jgi:DNA-binding NarL/FixJ family response regulator
MSALLEGRLERETGEASSPVASAVLVDRRPLVLATVARVLDSIGVEVCASGTRVEAALGAVVARRPDLFLLGLDAGEGASNGLRLVRRAHALVPGVKSIVLVDTADEAILREAVEDGASAAVLLSARRDDLAAAVRQTLRRSIYLAHPSAAFPGRPSAAGAPRAPFVRLTKREAEILRLVAEGRSNGEIARTLWLALPTIKQHLSHIYRKLDVKNRTEASRWAYHNGWCR